LRDAAGRVVAQTNPQGDPLPIPSSELVIEVDTGTRILGRPARKA